jgi:hypothetical protein
MINNEEVLAVQVNIQVIDFIKSLCWLGDFAPIPVLLLRDFFCEGSGFIWRGGRGRK